jgi:DNA-binding LytR/AlgR family response regulator
MMKAIAIDDELPALRIIENFCSKIDFIDLVKTFNKPTEAQKHLRKFPVELLFADINMPTITGIDLYKSLTQKTMVIFTTAYAEYAVEGFNVNAVDYLVKPFSFERFEQAVNRAHEYYSYQYQKQDASSPFIFIRADYRLTRITITDILFIEGLDDYIKIHLQDQKHIVARMTMKAILEKLPAKEFIRVHRSFIIPFRRIETVNNKIISLAGQEIRIGNSYEAEFFKSFIR